MKATSNAATRKKKKAILYMLFFVLAQIALTGYGSRAQSAWTLQTSSTSTDLYGIGYGNGMFIAVGPSGTVLSSANGLTWSAQTISGNPSLEDVIYSGGKWIIVGDAGVIYTSTNGTTWSSQTSGTTGNIYGLASNGTLVVAAATNGDIIRSTDGVSWAKTTVSAVPDGIEYGNGIFVAVGDNGKVLTSPDGVTWTNRTSGTTNPLFRVAYGNNLFVAVGQVGTTYTTGFILTSPDGITWTQRAIPGGVGPLTGVLYIGGKFLAVGYGGAILSSADGITWTSETSATTNDLYDVAWGGSRFAAVGVAGTIETQDFVDLPLTWLSFTAVQENKVVALKWTTTSELQTADFVVQNSTDGLHWKDLGTVKAAGYSNQDQTYSFVHSHPADGTNEYRLLQRDINGEQQYSKIVSLVCHAAAGFTILQNPVNNTLALQFPATMQTGSLQVFDVTGKLIKEQKIKSGTTFYTLDVQGLAPGRYVVVLCTGNRKEAKQFTRQ